MKLHRFIGDFDLAGKTVELTDREFLNQLRNVLRLKSGDKIILCDGQGHDALASITQLKTDRIQVAIESVEKVDREPARHVILYCALLKRENFELVAQKATEIGVKEIVPLVTQRTVKLNVNNARVNKIIREAAEQSGRGTVPTLHPAVTFSDALEHLTEEVMPIFFHGEGKPWSGLFAASASSIAAFIGPEGGWNEEEVKAAEAKGLRFAHVGSLTLRGETAAIIASYLCCQG